MIISYLSQAICLTAKAYLELGHAGQNSVKKPQQSYAVLVIVAANNDGHILASKQSKF